MQLMEGKVDGKTFIDFFFSLSSGAQRGKLTLTSTPGM